MKIKQAAKMWWFRYTANRVHNELITNWNLAQNLKIMKKLKNKG